MELTSSFYNFRVLLYMLKYPTLKYSFLNASGWTQGPSHLF